MKNPVEEDSHHQAGRHIDQIVLLRGESRDRDRRSPKKKERELPLLLVQKQEGGQKYAAHMQAWAAVGGCVGVPQRGEEIVGKRIQILRKRKVAARISRRPHEEDHDAHNLQRQEGIKVLVEVLEIAA